jgi:hypothetical protein
LQSAVLAELVLALITPVKKSTTNAAMPNTAAITTKYSIAP